MRKESLKGELWEAQGLLYIILGYHVGIQWISVILWLYGAVCIISGFAMQAIGILEDRKVDE